MTDNSELKRLAEACGDLNWRFLTEKLTEYGIRDDHGYIAFLPVGHPAKYGACPTREAKARFLGAMTPVAVLALIAENEQLRAGHSFAAGVKHSDEAATKYIDEHWRAQRDQLKAENAGLKTGYEAYEQVNAELKAEVEALRATVDLQKLLPEISDALEELELHGLHSDQGYRKLRDWYRKVGLAYRVIQGPMFGAEHGELVSQNTWLRSVVEHYAQQHAPLEPIPDSDGWSTRLPGYDLPTLLRDAERYRWLRDQHWNEADMAVVCHPKKSVKLGFDCPSGERLDESVDAAMGKGERS